MIRTNRLLPFALLAALLLLLPTAPPAQAQGVNLKNGNFYISYTDAEAPGLEIQRTYNSKSTHEGMFGYGWGWHYETHLYPLGDGSVVVREHGGGGQTRFEPAFPDPEARARALDQIVAARVEQGALRSPEARADFRTEIRESTEKRFHWWTRLVASGDLAPYDPPVGTRWAGSERGFQRIERTEAGYRRTSSDKTEDFDAAGRLVRITDDDGTRTLGYDEEGRLAWIESARGARAEFTLDADGRIARIVMTDGDGDSGAAAFTYDDENNLVDSRDAGGNRYQYEYDDVHNLTAIPYENGTVRRLTYDPDSYFLTRHEEPDGEVIRYEYENERRADGSADEDRYTTRVIRTRPSGEEVVNSYTYEIRATEFGRRYTYRLTRVVGGRRTETTYGEHGLPLSIRRNGRETTFAYDARGYLIRKANEEEVLLNTYDLDINKLTRVERWTADESEQIEWYTFAYTDDGDLARAEHSDGRWAALTYNDAGKIVRMEGPDGWMTFAYGALGKPTRMTLDSGAELRVTYDDAGEIVNVDSGEGGHVAAMAVMQRFQALLDLVKPAGVNLSM